MKIAAFCFMNCALVTVCLRDDESHELDDLKSPRKSKDPDSWIKQFDADGNELDIKDTNMAEHGGDAHRQAMKVAAAADPIMAKIKDDPDWVKHHEEVLATGLDKEGNSRTTSSVLIFRIVNFQLTLPEPDTYGQFYEGDSYIVFHTHLDGDDDGVEEDVFKHDIYFWLGSTSSIDEIGVAAYKTVELDALFDDEPVQHRETQNGETEPFKALFPNGITYLKGGAVTGFKRGLNDRDFEAVKFFQLRRDGKKTVRTPVKRHLKLLEDTAACFIMQAVKQTRMWIWCGEDAKLKLKYEAQVEARQMVNAVGKEVQITIAQDELNEFKAHLVQVDDDKEEGSLYMMDFEGSDETVKEVDFDGDVSHKDLVSTAVMMLVTQKGLVDGMVKSTDKVSIYVWMGSDADEEEQKNAMNMALAYLRRNDVSAQDPTFDPKKDVYLLKETKEQCAACVKCVMCSTQDALTVWEGIMHS